MREAETAEELMRSRFSAFARKEVEYLWRTLHPEHEDRAREKVQVMAELREACARNRYLGLRIVGTGENEDGTAWVAFVAKVFRTGEDVSFGERSTFGRAEGGWRYWWGEAARSS